MSSGSRFIDRDGSSTMEGAAISYERQSLCPAATSFTSFVGEGRVPGPGSNERGRPAMGKRIAACLLGVMGSVGALGNARAQSSEAYQVMQATNEDRAQHGLGPLKWDPALARAAQRHAELMVRQGALSHQYAGEAALETRVGMQGAHFRVV